MSASEEAEDQTLLWVVAAECSLRASSVMAVMLLAMVSLVSQSSLPESVDYHYL
jgi:hypothetical protein